MPPLFDVVFASSNKNKYLEAKKILANFGIKLRFFRCSLKEIQANSLKKIASEKATDAYRKWHKPVIVEDDGLFIESLNGFPGPFSSYVFKTIGNEGILQLVGKNRKARFQSVIAYCDKKNGVILFEANVKGKISRRSSGKGWGYDPIFIPQRRKETYAILSDKNKISHRYKSLEKFSNWYVNMQGSNDQ